MAGVLFDSGLCFLHLAQSLLEAPLQIICLSFVKVHLQKLQAKPTFRSVRSFERDKSGSSSILTGAFWPLCAHANALHNVVAVAHANVDGDIGAQSTVSSLALYQASSRDLQQCHLLVHLLVRKHCTQLLQQVRGPPGCRDLKESFKLACVSASFQ